MKGHSPTDDETGTRGLDLRRLFWRNYQLLGTPLTRLPFMQSKVFANSAAYIGRFVRRVLSRSVETVSEVHGQRMWFPPRSHSYIEYATGSYEPGTTRLVGGIVRPGMIVADVGAHIGYYSVLFARMVAPQGTVYAFEPDPSNYAYLTRNIEASGYGKNVVTVKKAIANTVGTFPFFLDEVESGHSLYSTRPGVNTLRVSGVETTTLDRFFEQEGWPSVDLVKLDIEGAELGALAGMRRLLELNRYLNLLVEFYPRALKRAGIAPPELLKKLTQSGFSISFISDDGTLTDVSLGSLDRYRHKSTNLFCSRNRIGSTLP